MIKIPDSVGHVKRVGSSEGWQLRKHLQNRDKIGAMGDVIAPVGFCTPFHHLLGGGSGFFACQQSLLSRSLRSLPLLLGLRPATKGSYPLGSRQQRLEKLSRDSKWWSEHIPQCLLDILLIDQHDLTEACECVPVLYNSLP